jgi:predicted flap endonuclease-1-like 5' DNA nuclease
MQWLVANMWMALAAATVLGLFFGFSFRGLLVGSRIRRAQVEREIARTELTQTKAEVEALYAAQRKRKEDNAQAVGGDDGLQSELEERETRISALGDELAAARSELEQLKTENGSGTGLAETAGAAVAGAVAGVVLSDGDGEELTQLRDRNGWLEERVAALEADLSAQPIAAPVETEESPAEADPALEKLRWQTGYLRQRVDALETSVIGARTAESVVTAASVEETPVVDEPAEDLASAESDEELARLRWRNRYLEGRLAYFEAGEAEAEEAEAEAAETAEEPETEQAASEEPEADVDEPETPSESEPEAETAAAAEAEEVHPSEAMLAELEGVQPEQIEKPENGGDDLTAITGIGPRIGEVLNELGIFVYSQIAAWTPENETWIENHLSFKGRVSRENWVEQAKAFLAE